MGYAKWELPENEARLRRAVAESHSIAQVCRVLGIAGVGGNYQTIKHHITRMGLDTSHHLGQAWNRDNYRDTPASRMETVRNRLIFKRGRKCERCELTMWFDQPIPLEMEHKDGNRVNNDWDNLELLCCNCHALTPTWRRKKRTQPRVVERYTQLS